MASNTNALVEEKRVCRAFLSFLLSIYSLSLSLQNKSVALNVVFYWPVQTLLAIIYEFNNQLPIMKQWSRKKCPKIRVFHWFYHFWWWKNIYCENCTFYIFKYIHKHLYIVTIAFVQCNTVYSIQTIKTTNELCFRLHLINCIGRFWAWSFWLVQILFVFICT